LNGEVSSVRNLGLFGEVTDFIKISAAGSAVNYGFTGREFDAESGFTYHRARQFNSATSRWLSQDPIGRNSGDSNYYRYVGNDPLTSVDPKGTDAGVVTGPAIGIAILCPECVIGAAAGIAIGAGGFCVYNKIHDLINEKKAKEACYAKYNPKFQYCQTLPTQARIDRCNELVSKALQGCLDAATP
jgi:RHS repeat-associated protein